MSVQTREITIAHSPDSDDAFMFYALAENKIDKRGLVIHQVMKDIQTLNEEAMHDKYDVSAISFAAYPYLHDRYMLMPCGASMGERYGPIIVSKREMSDKDLAGARIAIPGKLTTAYLALNLYRPGLSVVEVPFEKIIDEVVAGNYDAGLLIHEGQLTYASHGLVKLVDLGQWWHDETGLPLPLGANVVAKHLGDPLIKQVTKLMQDSIRFSLANRNEAMKYAMAYSPGLSDELADRFIGMYVNELTVDCGERGKQAVKMLFDVANQKNIFQREIIPQFVEV